MPAGCCAPSPGVPTWCTPAWRSAGPTATLVTEVVTTSVTFAELSDEVIAWYVATGEPADKAGAYGLQGIGGALVERIDGSVSNVLGLPLTTVRRLLGTGRLALAARGC